jgi:hypothetical protein
MPPSARITFRLTSALEALVSDRVRQGHHVSDIIRDALEMYFGVRQTGCPTPGAAVSDSTAHVSDTVSDISTTLSDVVSDVSDVRERLGQLEARLDALAPGVRQRPTPRLTPPPRPATPAAPAAALPGHIQRIAETAMHYDKLTLADLSQLLFDRQIYRAHDRKTGAEKPVNRGTLQKWLDQARRAGVL